MKTALTPIVGEKTGKPIVQIHVEDTEGGAVAELTPERRAMRWAWSADAARDFADRLYNAAQEAELDALFLGFVKSSGGDDATAQNALGAFRAYRESMGSGSGRPIDTATAKKPD